MSKETNQWNDIGENVVIISLEESNEIHPVVKRMIDGQKDIIHWIQSKVSDAKPIETVIINSGLELRDLQNFSIADYLKFIEDKNDK
jgi:hypothetical protein